MEAEGIGGFMKKKIINFSLIILSLLICFPIIMLLTNSFMGKEELKEFLVPILSGGEEYISLKLFPKFPTFKNYVKLLLDTPEFFVMYWNSVKIVLFVLLGQLLVGVPAAWGLAQYNFPLKKLLFTIYIVVMLMPFQVTMLSNYLVLDKLNFIDTHLSIIIPGMFSTFPIFIMYRFFSEIPKEIVESARVDGANEFQIFIKIAIPLGRPGIISAMILGFFEYWNIIEQPMTFLKDKTLWPLSLYLPNISLENADIAFTASAITLLTAIIIFFAGQKYLEQGILASAVKG